MSEREFMTRLTVIRHGETDLNRAGSFQGQIDAPLNARGHEQAQRLAARLKDESFDKIYASDLQRAVQTASPIAQHLGLLVNPVSGLREQHFGELEGMTLVAVREQFPSLWQTWLLQQADFAVPGGESVRQFSRRVLAATLKLAQQHSGQHLLVVAHGGVLDMLYRYAHAAPLDGPRVCAIPNTGLNRLRVDGQAIQIELWGDDAHLSGL